jgi:hypothetical protein
MTFISGAHFVINRAWALHHKLGLMNKHFVKHFVKTVELTLGSRLSTWSGLIMNKHIVKHNGKFIVKEIFSVSVTGNSPGESVRQILRLLLML